MAVNPANSHSRDPGLDVEIDRQAHEQAHRIEQQRCLDGVRPETLADVIDGGRNADERPNRHEKLGDSHDRPVQSELHRRADQAQAQGHQDEVGGPQRVKPILGLPDPIVAGREPERDTVTKEVTIDEAYHEAGPMDKCERSILCDGEAVDAAGLQRHLKPDWCKGVEGDVEAERYGVETRDDQDDWSEHHLERLDKHSALRESQSTSPKHTRAGNLTMSPQDTPAPTFDPKKNVS